MTKHTLIGRTEDEVLWFQRRSFLQGAAAWTAMGGYEAAYAQQRSNIVEMVGDVNVNGERLLARRTLQTGDQIATGPESHLVFVIGNSSFLVRQNSRMAVERGATLNTVSVLRLLTGAVASIWGSGSRRQIVTPTLTAGIRGTGVYTEVLPAQAYRSYFCNCYGTVDMNAGGDRLVSRSSYHQSFWGEAELKNGRLLTPAGAINHTDEEMEYLAGLVHQQTAWQALGHRGVKDGKGYMEQMPPEAHPATQAR
ncbi:MAG: iron dicitrate transport regulator FecR [Pseudomonadota bacterium]|nr:iron dicitrate transport regulator FecR [Pseudomonadota bacterium]